MLVDEHHRKRITTAETGPLTNGKRPAARRGRASTETGRCPERSPTRVRSAPTGKTGVEAERACLARCGVFRSGLVGGVSRPWITRAGEQAKMSKNSMKITKYRFRTFWRPP